MLTIFLVVVASVVLFVLDCLFFSHWVKKWRTTPKNTKNTTKSASAQKAPAATAPTGAPYATVNGDHIPKAPATLLSAKLEKDSEVRGFYYSESKTLIVSLWTKVKGRRRRIEVGRIKADDEAYAQRQMVAMGRDKLRSIQPKPAAKPEPVKAADTKRTRRPAPVVAPMELSLPKP
jgi:hypothetical protein